MSIRENFSLFTNYIYSEKLVKFNFKFSLIIRLYHYYEHKICIIKSISKFLCKRYEFI